MEPIVNRVAESEIELFDLASLWDGRAVDELDIAPFLVQGLILREVPFREAVKAYDWAQHAGRHVAVNCSADAIVPIWAYMLVATRLEGVAASLVFGTAEDLRRDYFAAALAEVDWEIYRDKPVVVKGCGSAIVPTSAYVAATARLQRVARKLMFGEPCSSVPLWRRPKATPPARAAAKPASLPGKD